MHVAAFEPRIGNEPKSKDSSGYLLCISSLPGSWGRGGFHFHRRNAENFCQAFTFNELHQKARKTYPAAQHVGGSLEEPECCRKCR